MPFAEAIRGGKPPYPDGRAGRNALKASLAAERSISEGRVMRWSEL